MSYLFNTAKNIWGFIIVFILSDVNKYCLQDYSKCDPSAMKICGCQSVYIKYVRLEMAVPLSPLGGLNQ